MKRKAEDNTSWWFYFLQVENKTKAMCKTCDEVFDRDEHASTSGLKHHLQKKHPNLYGEKLEAERLKKQKQEAGKALMIASSKDFFKPILQSKISELNQPTIEKSFGVWDEDGASTSKLDRLILEMVCVDITPLSIVEKPGFRRLMDYLAPKYKMKSRKYFAETELPKTFNECFLQIKRDLKNVSFVSFTTDAWSSRDQSHSLLSLTCHYIDDDFKPCYAVLGASPIVGRHTADTFCELLLKVLSEFDISSEKIHLFLRDAAASMKKTTRLLGVTSFDCFAHKLQLSVKDGFNHIDGFSVIIEKCKKIVKRIRKSDITRDEFKVLQKMCDLPVRLLKKDVEVRWNSSYKMLDSFILNRQAVGLLSQESEMYPSFSAAEWSIMESVVAILKPIYLSTMDLQKRTTTIAAVIPMLRTVLFKLDQQQENVLSLYAFRNAVISGLEQRMRGWEYNRHLLLATMLDPQYKMKFLPKNRHLEYRQWFEEEAESHSQPCFVEETPVGQCTKQSEYDSMMTEFLDFQEGLQESVCVLPLTNSDIRKKARVEVAEYLAEDVILLSSDPFAYWKVQGARWTILQSMMKKYHSAPGGSMESERLFSKAGLIVTDLRKSLTSNNLRMLLFIHNNLPLSKIRL